MRTLPDNDSKSMIVQLHHTSRSSNFFGDCIPLLNEERSCDTHITMRFPGTDYYITFNNMLNDVTIRAKEDEKMPMSFGFWYGDFTQNMD